MGNVEMMLAQWTENQHQNAIPLSLMIMQAQNTNATESVLEMQSFAATAGWCQCFKECHGIHNQKLTGNTAAVDLLDAEKFPMLLQVTNKRHGYLPQ